MEKCKYCEAELEENSSVCPQCGRDNAAEEAKEETVEAAPEEISAETAEEMPAEEPKAGILLTPGKIAAIAAAFIVLLAIIVGLVVSGKKQEAAPAATEPAATEQAAEPTAEPTIPADGNPEDVTCKGTYYGDSAALQAAESEIVATAGDQKLTNEDLQVFYWMEVRQFLSNYGSYIQYMDLDLSRSLDTQPCTMAEGLTWHQYFLEGALNTWASYAGMANEAEKAGYVMDEEFRQILDEMPADMEETAKGYGMESADAMLKKSLGEGVTMEAYLRYMEMYYKGYGYYGKLVSEIQPTDAEVEAFFAENEAAYSANGLTKDTKSVDVRHILIYPEGADSSTVRTEEFSEEAWAAGEAKAQEILDKWLAGDKTEDSFAALANEYSGDPGSNTNGGLYTDVREGQMVEEFNNWCFDPQRQPGDTGIVKTTFGFHIMYYVGGHTLWQDTARQDMISRQTEEMITKAMEAYPLKADYSKIVLGNVDIMS